MMSYNFLNQLPINDAAENWQCLFQDSGTPTMEGIVNFHHDLTYILIVICVMVVWLLSRALYFFNRKNNIKPAKFIHGTTIEIVWTTTPAIVLIFIAVPSLALLYSMDEIIDPAMTLKVMGHQWYWSYQYSDYTDVAEDKSLDFESYMISELDFKSYIKNIINKIIPLLELQQQSNIGLAGCIIVVSVGFAVFAYTYFYPFKPFKKVLDAVRSVPLDSVGGVLLLPLLPIVHYTWAWNSSSPVIYTLSEIWFAHSNSYFNTDYLMFILTNNLY